MKYTILLAGLTSTALAQNSTFTTSTSSPPSTTTDSILTTVCGTATVLTQNGNLYTCTEAMTLTFNNCPCTMTRATSSPTAIPSNNALVTFGAASAITIISVTATCPASAVTQGHALGTSQAIGTGATMMPYSTQALTHQLTNDAPVGVAAYRTGAALVALAAFLAL